MRELVFGAKGAWQEQDVSEPRACTDLAVCGLDYVPAGHSMCSVWGEFTNRLPAAQEGAQIPSLSHCWLLSHGGPFSQLMALPWPCCRPRCQAASRQGLSRPNKTLIVSPKVRGRWGRALQ